MTTLIFRFSSLGDVAISVPVIRCLSKKYPNHNFIVVSREKFKPLFAESPNVSFFACDFKGRHKGFKGLINLYKDCLLYTSPSPRDATLSRMPSSA